MVTETLLKQPPCLIGEPNATFLSNFTTMRRETVRPEVSRGSDFDEQFDADTLFFDIFRSPDLNVILAIGPPFANFADQISRAQIRDARTGKPLRFKVLNLDRQSQIWIEAGRDVEAIILQTSFGEVRCAVETSKSDLFEGLRVLWTKSKNNPILWITDWVRFNRDVHGAQAVLLYDNGSSQYTLADLLVALKAIAGIQCVVVVDWPFKFGPQGSDWHRHWDSDFCELGALEHARRFFLERARSVLVSDVDELTIGSESVFQAVESSRLGIARFYGRWMVDSTQGGAAPISLIHRRHRHYDIVLRKKIGLTRLFVPTDVNRSNSKWAVVPAKCPRHSQWHVHKVKGWVSSQIARSDFSCRHFRPMNTSWKYDREERAEIPAKNTEMDTTLIEAFAKVRWNDELPNLC